MPIQEVELLPEQVTLLRQKFAEEAKTNADDFDPIDVKVIASNDDDWVVRRFLLAKYGNEEESLKAMVAAMKRRKERDSNSMTSAEFPIEFFKSGAFFTYGRDKAGARILILRVKVYDKNNEWKDHWQRYFLFLVERVDKEQPEKEGQKNKITVIFDCTGAGKANVNKKMFLFIVNLMRDDYPMLLNAFLVYNASMIHKMILKEKIKKWTTEDQADFFKYVTRAELKDHIESDQLPDFMGGCSELSYREVPKNALPAEELAKKLKIKKKHVDQLLKMLQPYLKGE